MKRKQVNMLEPATVNRLSVVTISLFADFLICEVNLKMDPASLEYQEVFIFDRAVNNPSPI